MRTVPLSFAEERVKSLAELQGLERGIPVYSLPFSTNEDSYSTTELCTSCNFENKGL